MARARLRRLIAELRAAPGPRDAAAALARLRLRETREAGRDIAEIELREGGAEREGERIDELRDGSYAVVRIARGVYQHVPTAGARVRLLEAAARAARDEVVVHVTVTDDDSHLGRLAIDAPRRVLRRVGIRSAEPGDRGAGARHTHGFFDEEALLVELARARLVVKRRSGFTFTLRRAEPHELGVSAERAASFVTELVRVLPALREIDARRSRETPQRLLAALRERGARLQLRGPIGRARLRRAIGWIDALAPGGRNCYRRILLEIALDSGAAGETVVFGLDVGSTGHVAFQDREERAFDVAFAIPADTPRTRS